MMRLLLGPVVVEHHRSLSTGCLVFQALSARSPTASWLSQSRRPLHDCRVQILSKLLRANRSLSHANRVSGRAFSAHRETDFGRQRPKAQNRLRAVFLPYRDREPANAPAPNRGKSRVFRGDEENSNSAGLRGGGCSLRRTSLHTQIP
jgi:hypothetical protein